jgi:hypothetical protein
LERQQDQAALCQGGGFAGLPEPDRDPGRGGGAVLAAAGGYGGGTQLYRLQYVRFCASYTKRFVMKCPDCENIIETEDWMDNEPFGCPHCGIILQMVTDEGGYCGAHDKRLVLCE